MRRSELSAEGAIWTIPASRTKNKKEFVLPLPPLARDIIAGVKQVERSDFVFTTTGRTAVSGFSKTKKRLDELMSENASENNVSILDTLTAWRLHDLRRTAATIMNDSPPNGLGIAPHIVEACLNHISGSRVGVAGVYNRAEYLPEKLAAFQRWAAWIGGLVTDQPSATVTPIGKKRQ
jgi:integrase